MSTRTRREVVYLSIGMGVAAASSISGPFRAFATPALSSQSVHALSDAISDIERQADELQLPPGPSFARSGAGTPLSADDLYLSGMERLLSVMDRAGTAQRASALTVEAGKYLGILNALEHVTPDAFSRSRIPAPNFADVVAGYRTLFDGLTVRPSRASDVTWYAGRLRMNQARYETVAAEVRVPWYFIGIIHALEASFNFQAHLHNGDPLSARTTHVPAHRPKKWLPPYDWESSAKDALDYDGFLNKTNWSVERMLYRWEAFNGFGYRSKHPIGDATGHVNTPYLWSFSTAYDEGKFTDDGKWNATAVSGQCGAAVLLKTLIDAGDIQPPRS